MPDVQNILYVTTRQWNPGDEFILAGVRAIVAELGWKPKLEAIYNKSPQVVAKLSRYNPFRLRKANYSAGYVDAFIRTAHFDNSFGPHNDIGMFDAVIFCGSPGWFGGRLHSIYSKLVNYDGLVLFLGIGSSNRDTKLSGIERGVLARADLVTTRDEALKRRLHDSYEIEAEWLTCPALLAAPFEQTPDPAAPVGLVFTSAQTNRGQRVSEEHAQRQNQIFRDVIAAHPTAEVVCNYYDEVDEAARLFGLERVRYTFEAREYANLMASYRYVVSSRVHGCGISSSAGVPNVLLGHDKRAATVAGFGSSASLDTGEILRLIESASDSDSLARQSERLVDEKKRLMSLYVSTLASSTNHNDRTAYSGGENVRRPRKAELP